MMSAVSNLFGSVMVRLALIFGLLATLVTAAIVISWFVFQSISSNMQTLSDERIPLLNDTARMVSVADRVRGLLSDLLILKEPEGIDRLSFKKNLVMEDLAKAADSFSDDTKREELSPLVSSVDGALDELIEARRDEFNSLEAVTLGIEAAMLTSEEVRAVLADIAAGAYLDLVIGGEETVEFIDTTLTTLIDEDFTSFQNALGVRAEVNLMMGAALSLSQTNDRAIIAILSDLGIASSERLFVMKDQLASYAATEDLAVAARNASEQLAAVFNGNRFAVSPSELLSMRQEIDAILSEALDTIYFDLIINSEEVKTSNSETISALMENQVGEMQRKFELVDDVGNFLEQVMFTALSRDIEELRAREAALQKTAENVRASVSNAPEDLKAEIERILSFADVDSGIGVLRANALTAQQTAADATASAAESVRQIAMKVGEFADIAQSNIAASADMLSGEAVRARVQIESIGVLAFAIVALSPFLIWFSVTRPLNRVTSVTERLANGDLSEITELDRQKGEIGRMANALKIFREGALERIRMQEVEKDRQAELDKAEREAERQKHEAELRERQAKEEREREERERMEAEQAKEEKRRAAEEEERRVRAEEQELVVSELATSLRALSDGDLTRTISVEFPGNYENLRKDFNSAIANLAALVKQLEKSSNAIDSGSSEIAAAALDLSRRTESSAATLEETAAALHELTSSVSSAAQSASRTTETVDGVKRDAENSQKVMNDAVQAMGQIETSAAEIAKIVEVIDSIAFQTNLLALNAGVEAARAGDAGRGFAVVASEVRILAHRCSDAAEEINKLITESSGHVSEGVALIDRTSEALETILNGVLDMSRNVSAIAVSSQEQSNGISEINVAVEQLDRATQRNAAMFEETTAASQALTGEAKKLSASVSEFCIETNGVEGAVPAKLADKSAA